MSSIQKNLGRVRPEIFHIEYEVDVGDAIEKRELAFVMGVMADLSGDRDREKPLPDLGALDKAGNPIRPFLDIDRDNIGDIQEKINPHLDLLVKNELARDGTNLDVKLNFPGMDSFSPAGVIKQVEPLKALLDIRQQLASLAARIDGKQEVTSRLEELLRRAEQAGAGPRTGDAEKPAGEKQEEEKNHA